VLRHQLKSKIHRARVTDSNIDYEGSISIPTDLMEAVDLWVGEKVLVTSITSGARLETYVIPGKAKSRHIVVNGAAAHLIGTGAGHRDEGRRAQHFCGQLRHDAAQGMACQHQGPAGQGGRHHRHPGSVIAGGEGEKLRPIPPRRNLHAGP
jgi:aspartate 1-decarboxylase